MDGRSRFKILVSLPDVSFRSAGNPGPVESAVGPPRTTTVLFLTAPFIPPLLPVDESPFLAWALVGVALALSFRSHRRPSAFGIVSLALLVLATIVLAGISIRGGGSFGGDAGATAISMFYASVLLPPTLFILMGGGPRPARAISAASAGIVLVWLLLFAMSEAGWVRDVFGEGDILLLLVAAVLFVSALLWRRWRPVRP